MQLTFHIIHILYVLSWMILLLFEQLRCNLGHFLWSFVYLLCLDSVFSIRKLICKWFQWRSIKYSVFCSICTPSEVIFCYLTFVASLIMMLFSITVMAPTYTVNITVTGAGCCLLLPLTQWQLRSGSSSESSNWVIIWIYPMNFWASLNELWAPESSEHSSAAVLGTDTLSLPPPCVLHPYFGGLLVFVFPSKWNWTVRLGLLSCVKGNNMKLTACRTGCNTTEPQWRSTEVTGIKMNLVNRWCHRKNRTFADAAWSSSRWSGSRVQFMWAMSSFSEIWCLPQCKGQIK